MLFPIVALNLGGHHRCLQKGGKHQNSPRQVFRLSVMNNLVALIFSTMSINSKGDIRIRFRVTRITKQAHGGYLKTLIEQSYLQLWSWQAEPFFGCEIPGRSKVKRQLRARSCFDFGLFSNSTVFPPCLLNSRIWGELLKTSFWWENIIRKHCLGEILFGQADMIQTRKTWQNIATNQSKIGKFIIEHLNI